MGSNLAQIFRIRKMLNKIKYPDSYRIAREIVSFLDNRKGITEDKILKRLYKREPWEYVRGFAQFCGMDFKVNRYTLIPRIETEQLVNDSLDIVKKSKIKNIIDVGTGSGCIAISIAKGLEQTDLAYSIYATDISKRALKIAKKNERKLLKKPTIKWIAEDLIKNVPKIKGATLLVANLPYIPTTQYENLDKSVKKFEPKLALDGGDTGLDIYTKLFKQIQKSDIKIKNMYIETEEKIYKETVSLIKEYFEDAKTKTIKDCFNKNRFIKVSL